MPRKRRAIRLVKDKINITLDVVIIEALERYQTRNGLRGISTAINDILSQFFAGEISASVAKHVSHKE